MKNVEINFDTKKITKGLLPEIKKELVKMAKSNFKEKTKHLTDEMEKENGKITISITPNKDGYKISYDADGFSPELESKLSAVLS